MNEKAREGTFVRSRMLEQNRGEEREMERTYFGEPLSLPFPPSPLLLRCPDISKTFYFYEGSPTPSCSSFTISRDRGFQPSRHFPRTILAMPICPFYSNVTFVVNSFSSSSSSSCQFNRRKMARTRGNRWSPFLLHLLLFCLRSEKLEKLSSFFLHFSRNNNFFTRCV